MSKGWYKLDNAAKIFPAIYTKNDTSSFRVSAVLKDDIDESILHLSLKMALERFPSFCVKLKRGFFWYYFDHNYDEPIIQKENSKPYDTVRIYENNNFMFTLSYSKKRLILEIFHALSDGTGGMDFFKTICYYYLLNKSVAINNTGEIKTNEVEINLVETEDSFIGNYDKNVPVFEKEEKAFRITGKYYPEGYSGLIHTIMSVTQLKEVSRKYNATITEYMGACILNSIYVNYLKGKISKKNVKLFIPVNARKFFDSKSIRNFVLYVRTNCDFNGKDLEFVDMINYMQETFKKELTKERLHSRLVSNVIFEKKMIVRILPLFLKRLGLKIGFKLLGSDANTVSFSNLGKVELPKDMEPYFERFEFAIGASKSTPVNIGAVSFLDKFVLTFTTRITDRTFIKGIIKQFKFDELDIIIETNDLEVQ